MAIIGATELQPVNILGSYMQGMELGRANQLARQQAAATQQKAETDQRQAEQNQLMEEAKLREQRGKAMKAETEGLEGRMQYWRRLIPADPRLAPAWVSAAYSDPVVGPELSKMGSAEEVIAGIPRDPDGYMQWVEGASMFADKVAERRTVTAENMLPYNQPMSPEVFEQQLALRSRGAPRTTIEAAKPAPSETELEKEIGKTAAARLDKFRTNADSAVNFIQLASQLRPLLDSKNFISGTFADARLAVAKAVGINVADTESYFAGIGRQVGELIKQFGAGTGLSDADREFAQKIAGGAPVTSVAGIRQIMKINEKASRNVIASYNKERTFLGKDRPAVLSMYPEINVQREVLRTGKLNGRKVVEYSDGSIEYGD
jgi:hypothetical protein